MEPSTSLKETKHGNSSPNGNGSQIFRNLSGNSISTNFTIDSTEIKAEKSADRKRIRSLKAGSAYIKNYRFSRYQNAITSSMPYRNTTISKEELPIDGIGCFSNASFAWANRYMVRKGESAPETLPRSRFVDSCAVNAKRLLGIYKYDEQSNGRISCSTSWVAWKFCRTRVILGMLMHMLSVLMALIAIGVFLTLVLQAMEGELNIDQCTNATNASDIANLDAFIEDAAREVNQTAMNILSNATKYDVSSMVELNASTTTVKPTAITIVMTNVTTPPTTNATNTSSPTTTEWDGGEAEEPSDWRVELYGMCIPLCLFGMFIFQSISNWINLRTAYRLRTACISSAFTRAMKSSITYKLEFHEILSHACSEGELLYSLILNGTQIVGTIFGLLMYYVATLMLLGVRGFWPLWGIFGLVLATITLAKVSAFYSRRSINYAKEKFHVILELCSNFTKIFVLNFQEIFEDKFTSNVSRQYTSYFISEMYGTQFWGGLTSAMILSALYVVWCDVDIKTDTIPILVLIIMYAHFVQILISDFSEAVLVFLKGKKSIDKLKTIYTFAQSEPSRSKPSKHLQVYISQAAFDWDYPQDVYVAKKNNEMHPMGDSRHFTLNIEELFIPKNQIVGVTGAKHSGKSSLCYAILGHMRLLKGDLFSHGRLAYFPQDASYMRMGSVKDNVCFGSEFDSTQYYRAIALGFLNHDVCNELGKDDVPIEELQLSAEQMQRIDMARAVFSENRDMFIFDDPLRYVADSAEAALLFKNMSDYLIQTRKTILVATNNEEILKLCNRIYAVDGGHLSESCEYGDLYHMPSFRKIMADEAMLRSCCRFDGGIVGPTQGDSTTLSDDDDFEATSHHTSQFNYLHTREHSNDLLIDGDSNASRSKPMTIKKYFVLLLLCAINTFGYICMPTAFVVAVSKEFVHLWPVIISIGILALIFFADILSKYTIYKAACQTCTQYYGKMFKSLLRSSASHVNKSTAQSIIHNFMADKFEIFKVHGRCSHYAMMILVTGTLLILVDYLNGVIVALLIIVPIIIFRWFRHTVVAMHCLESASRSQMFQSLANTLEGRAVIQSFEKLDEFRNDFYSIVEENSMAIFLRKSTEFFSEFLHHMVQVTFLLIFCVIQMWRALSVYRFAIGILAYLSFAYNLSKLLRILYERVVAIATLRRANQSSKIWGLDSRAREQKDTPNTVAMASSIAITFNAVAIQINGKYLLQINKLHISAAEKVGIKGDGAHLLVSLLYGTLEPTCGVIFIDQYDVRTFPRSYFAQNFGIVPHEPLVSGVTIRSILDPNNIELYTTISEALKSFNLWQLVTNLPLELDEPIENLDQVQRQMICLVRCCLHVRSVIVVEYPRPELQPAISLAIDKYFIESTVVIIGRHEIQFSKCHRIVDLNNPSHTGFELR